MPLNETKYEKGFETSNEQPPKTLISGIRSSNENKCNGLRTYGIPTDVKVFKATPDWAHKHVIGEPIRTDPSPTAEDLKPYFNGKKKGK